jgi:hypothetical protein
VIVPAEPEDAHIVWILGETLSTLPLSTDLILILDTSLLTRTALSSEVFAGYNIMSIDHHEAFSDAVP